MKLVFIVLIALLSGCAAYTKLSHGYQHPSDSELAELFNTREDDFVALVTMFLDDAKGKSHHFWIGLNNAWTLEDVSDDRRRRYIELMSTLGVRSIGFVPEIQEIVELTFTSGHGNKDYEVDVKGIAFSPHNTPPKTFNLGETDFWGGYKSISGNWYIFHHAFSGPGE